MKSDVGHLIYPATTDPRGLQSEAGCPLNAGRIVHSIRIEDVFYPYSSIFTDIFTDIFS
uniref:Uncharacterized protein n=1 Tax=Heterorhabditis bacteriophora TaxID=37862 RepID=A0A1I7X256_HETBA